MVEIIKRIKRFFGKTQKPNPFVLLNKQINKSFKQSWNRQHKFKNYVQRFSCPQCNEKSLQLMSYENSVQSMTYEILARCDSCQTKLLFTDHGVRVEYVIKPK